MAAKLCRKMKPFTDDLCRNFIKLQTSLKAEQNIRFTPGLLENKAEGIRNTNNTTGNSLSKKIAVNLHPDLKTSPTIFSLFLSNFKRV